MYLFLNNNSTCYEIYHIQKHYIFVKWSYQSTNSQVYEQPKNVLLLPSSCFLNVRNVSSSDRFLTNLLIRSSIDFMISLISTWTFFAKCKPKIYSLQNSTSDEENKCWCIHESEVSIFATELLAFARRPIHFWQLTLSLPLSMPSLIAVIPFSST